VRRFAPEEFEKACVFFGGDVVGGENVRRNHRDKGWI